MASPRQDQSQYEMMDQMMQMSKELSHEKTAHKKVIAQLEETKSCMLRVEAASLGTIKVLRHLIFHNQNVALNQQCMAKEKEAQAIEMQDLKQRTVELATNRDQLEILALKIKNRMLLVQNNQLRKEKGKKMSKTQTNEGRVQIQKLEKYVGNVETQLNHEKKKLTAKLSYFNLLLEDSCCSLKLEMKIDKFKTTELAAMHAKEKQQIMTQILSSQTELKNAMNMWHEQNKRNEELQQELKLESEQQSSNALETNNSEAMSTKLEIQSVEFTEDASQPSTNKIEALRTKIQELQQELKLESEQQSSNVLETNNSEAAINTELEMQSLEFTEDASQPSSNKIEALTTKIQELQQELKFESEQHCSNVLETNNSEAMGTKWEMQSIEFIEDASQHSSYEIEVLTTKIQEFLKEANNDLEACLATGMVKLQLGIDEFKKEITEKAEDEASKREFDLKKLQED